MRESIHALRCDFLCLQDTLRADGSGRAYLVGFHTITLDFYENRHFENEASVALNPLVSIFGRFVARGGRKRCNRDTPAHRDQVL